MFKRVENDLELAMFNGVWTTVWMEKGFDLEFSQDVLGQFLVVTDEGHYVARRRSRRTGRTAVL